MPTLNDSDSTRDGEENFYFGCLHQQFPAKLYKMLELSSASAVEWLPDGRAFRILDEREFLHDIIPLFFKITKLRSFYRQLNLWGFKRVVRGPDKGTCYHGLFVRDAPQEMRKMIRIKIKSAKARRGRLETERGPNFYNTPPSSPAQTSTCSNGSVFVRSDTASAGATHFVKPLPLSMTILLPEDRSAIKTKATMIEPLPYENDASFDELAGCLDELGSLLR